MAITNKSFSVFVAGTIFRQQEKLCEKNRLVCLSEWKKTMSNEIKMDSLSNDKSEKKELTFFPSSSLTMLVCLYVYTYTTFCVSMVGLVRCIP